MTRQAMPSGSAVGLQELAGGIALLVGLYAGYDLVFGVKDWRNALHGVVARCYLFALLTTVGIDAIFFNQNAILQFGYILGLPLLAVQVGFVLTLLVASYFWSGS
jgi:hypothetical protein